MISFGEYAEILARNAAMVRPRLEVGLHKVGELTKTMAAEYIGHEIPEWPPLAPSTITEKTRLGYVGHVSATDPLLRTGEMRDSIEVSVEGLEMAVGSKEKIALYQELGTSRIPPRPFLALAAQRSLPYAADVFGEIAVRSLVPPGTPVRLP
jgi:hypothetical protein